MHYDLFAFDLDGTLLTTDGTIPEATRAFVMNIARTAKVTLATGRSLASAQQYIVELRISTPVILYHGAIVWDQLEQRPILEHHIPIELARHALATARHPSLHVQVYRSVDDPHVYVASLTPPIAHFLAKERLPPREVGELAAILDRPPVKFLLIGPPSVLAEAEEALREAVPELSVVRSEHEYLEVLPPGVSKGQALTWLCAHLGVPLARVVAVGDQLSDLSMIELAGLGVAMSHAPQDLLLQADLVIPSVRYLEVALGKDPPVRERASKAKEAPCLHHD